MVKHIPNILTIANLFVGIIGIIFAFEGNLLYASITIWLAALFDFLDGFSARILKVTSAIGKELDSLSDLVSFGVLPATILFQLIDGKLSEPITLVVFVIAIFSAIRLARFNIDTKQTNSFTGMPTPAVAFFISGLHFWQGQYPEWFNLATIAITSIVLAILLISPINFLAFKFSDFSIRNNWQKYSILLISTILLIILQAKALPLIIAFYLLLSVILPKPKQQ